MFVFNLGGIFGAGLSIMHNPAKSRPCFWFSGRVRVAPKAERKSLPSKWTGLFRHEKKLVSYTGLSLGASERGGEML